MARKKREDSEVTADWITTYSDTVTLILCFFVLLFSFSTVDAQKFKEIAESLSQQGYSQGVSNIASIDIKEDNSSMGEVKNGPKDILYNTVKDYIDNHNLNGKVQLVKGDRTITLRFRDTVLFDPDSTVLKDDGKKLLKHISNVLKSSIELINSIQIEGHTAANKKGEPKFVNTFEFASARATTVLNHIWQHEGLPVNKLRAVSFGQYHPVASNQNDKTRKLNRRVEFVVSSVQVNDSVYQYRTSSGDIVVN